MQRSTTFPKGELALFGYAMALLCLVLLAYLALANFSQNGITTLAVSHHKQVKPRPGSPVRLEIPKINISANLDYVSLTPQGALGVPAVPMNAGWFDKGPRPGEKGSAVIDGHFGWKDHIPAVFDHLSALKKGDRLYVVDERGARIAFAVSQTRLYASDGVVPAIFRSSDGKSHLNLITCDGTWNEAQHSFSNRLVVFADKVTK